MNSLKTAVILAVLLGAAYWVYVSINSQGPIGLPPGAAPQWSSPVDVQLPSMGGAAPPLAGTPGMSGVPASSGVPGLPLGVAAPSGGAAPPFSTPPITVGTSEQPFAATPHSSSTDHVDHLPPPFPPGGYPSAASGSDQPNRAYPEGVAVASDLAGPAARLFAPPGAEADSQFEHLIETAQKQLQQGALAKALQTLSRFYGDSKFTPRQNAQIADLLDQVAGTVIYSRQHLLEPPHVVQTGETLDAIAQSYNVPAGLLAKINGISDPASLRPGQELKVVRGPFSAVIDLDDYELTLMVQGQYAGRFRIGLGHDNPQIEGTYVVQDKTVNPTYYGRDRVVEADDPRNPLGERWIGLGSPGGNPTQAARVGIHGTDNPLNIGTITEHGSICLGGRDAEDVYDILSVGSRVVIRR